MYQKGSSCLRTGDSFLQFLQLIAEITLGLYVRLELGVLYHETLFPL